MDTLFLIHNEIFLWLRDTQSANIQDNNTTSSVQRGNRLSVNTTGKPVQLRRSSVVVIPPMQVCPGDLLVYSKALTHGNNFTGNVLQYDTFTYYNYQNIFEIKIPHTFICFRIGWIDEDVGKWPRSVSD